MTVRAAISRALISGSLLLIAASAQASVQYNIAREALAPLSGPVAPGAKLTLQRIPIDGEPANLEVEPFEVFAEHAEIRVVGDNDTFLENLAPPKARYFRGRIAGVADSLVFLSVMGPQIEGVIFRGDRRFGVGSRRRPHRQALREGDGVDVFIQESDAADDLPHDGKGFTCELDGSQQISRAPSLSSVVRDLPPQTDGTLSTATARWVINMAIETDYELYVNASSSSSNVTTYIGNLVGAISTIYSRDLKADVVVSYLGIHTTAADPFTVVPGSTGLWNGSTITYSTLHALFEFGDRWHSSPPSSAPRSTTALLAGKTQTAGVAWVNVLCDPDFFCTGGNCGSSSYDGHYGGRYSYNGGIFPPGNLAVPDPNTPPYTAPSSNYWALLQVSHETGHNVFSGHTHCRQLSASDQATYGRQFVDKCHTSGTNCYAGATSVPPEKGTIMSYCHFSGGTQTRFTFGQAGEASYVVPQDLQAAIQSATPSLSAITAPASRNAGQTGTASITNVAGLTYEWTVTNGVLNSGQGTSSINFTANTNPTNVKVKATNTSGCSITDNKDVTVIAAYSPPTSVVATPVSASSVSVSWAAPGGTTPVQYRVYRSTNGVSFSFVSFVNHPTTGFTDNTASSNTAYLYVVRSADGSGGSESADSNRDLATTVVFSDDPLVAGTTVVDTDHFTQLRTAVNAVRTLASLGAGSYTDTLTAGVTAVRIEHVNDLRTALDAARLALGLPAISYGETLTSEVTTIKATHVTELRAGVK